MAKTRSVWKKVRADERPVEEFSGHGQFGLALAYANTYHIGMSSLGFQRTYELVNRTPDWQAERFFTNGSGMPLSVENDTPLSSFGAVAFSVSFEEDYVNLLQLLDRSGIPLLRAERTARDPVVFLGGSCATINPLTLSRIVDVFPLGAAENVLPELLAALAEESSREAVFERLSTRDGFFVPAHHEPEEGSFAKLKKLELTERQMKQPGHLPTTSIVTPHTEFSGKFLIEMSRGCPEKCRYCWATFGMGRFRWHPTEFILEALERARPITDQLGFVATAVGDHPDIELILLEANRQGFRTAVSSVRIPAVTESVLAALHASGDRSITLAPETGSDALRVKLNKPIPNAMLLEKVRMIFRHGFTQLKLYFLIGLPDESMEDVQAIIDLTAECRAIMLEELAPTGVIGHIHLGTNILIPKPYTGWQREAMENVGSLKKKIRLIKRGAGLLPNVSLGSMSVRQAIWQTYLSKAGPEATEPLIRRARGEGLSSVLRDYQGQIHDRVFIRQEGHLDWQFMKTG